MRVEILFEEIVKTDFIGKFAIPRREVNKISYDNISEVQLSGNYLLIVEKKDDAILHTPILLEKIQKYTIYT
jgi:hypothetical protein